MQTLQLKDIPSEYWHDMYVYTMEQITQMFTVTGGFFIPEGGGEKHWQMFNIWSNEIISLKESELQEWPVATYTEVQLFLLRRAILQNR